MNRKDLIKIYPWLSITTTVAQYVEPLYYNQLLKGYIFGGKSDLEHFRSFLQTCGAPLRVLELGCGNGRATNIFLKKFPKACLDLIDLSGQMLTLSKARFKKWKNLTYAQIDILDYLKGTKAKYDLIFTLWSFSHATHQLLSRVGLRRGKQQIHDVLKKMILKNMTTGSKFFLIHFDSRSDEQKILIRQWGKVFSIFRQNGLQSPSKLCIDKVLNHLARQGYIKYSLRHYVGEPIEYKSSAEAVEIFMNFHMESFFNQAPNVDEIIDELLKYFRKFQLKDGRVRIKPGCFIYKFTRVL